MSSRAAVGSLLILAACSTGPQPVEQAIAFDELGLVTELIEAGGGSGRQREFGETLQICSENGRVLSYDDVAALLGAEPARVESAAFQIQAGRTTYFVSLSGTLTDTPNCVELLFRQWVG